MTDRHDQPAALCREFAIPPLMLGVEAEVRDEVRDERLPGELLTPLEETLLRQTRALGLDPFALGNEKIERAALRDRLWHMGLIEDAARV